MLVVGIIGGFIAGIQNTLRAKFVKHLGVHEDVVTVASMMGAATSGIIGSLIVSGVPHLTVTFWLPFFVSVALNILIQFWNVKALKLEDASIVLPLSTAQPAIAIVMSFLILREWPTFYGRIGIGLIALGAYILYLKGKEVKLPGLVARSTPLSWHHTLAWIGAPLWRMTQSTGARLALAVAWLGAIAINFDKLATLASNPSFFSGAVFALVALAIWIHSSLRGRWHGHDKKHFGVVFLVGILMGIGVAFQNAVFLYGIAPYGGALRRTQVFWVILFATWFLGEKNTLLRLIGSIVIVIGTILIAL